MDRAWIIDSAIGTIDGFEALLGIGLPVSGDAFNTSSSWFTRTAQDQASAAPGDRWMGTAADAYSAKNELQKLREEILADLDYMTGTLVTDQADAVRKTRDVLAFAKRVLEIARPVAVVISYIPLVGQWLSDGFQLPITSLMMSMVTGALAYLAYKTAEDTAKLIAALWKLVELLEALIEEEVIAVVSDIEFDIRQFISKLESALYAAWSEIASIFSDMGLGTMLSSLSSLSGVAGMSGRSASAGAAAMPDLTHLADLAQLSDPVRALGGAGLPAMGRLGGAMTQMRSLPMEVGPIGSIGQAGNPALATGAQSSSGTPGLPGSVPHAPSRRPQSDGGSGGASGGADAERAPVDGPPTSAEKTGKLPIFVNAGVSKA
ncbi:EspA/EspE family type VII secretion system effector [Mycobacterium persicum]|uniref:ESX-1 secretion-associated protein EspA n=1 Tax=Mycobacterium persicum TaxID=1487726 RepID=A0A1X0LFZ5_9MYCO|nr:EspA/EspE family type VII secretion system effector [Mycobacterium persicum]KZS83899.1 hypothetical protein A4G31_26330 [Mycobacterium persicum]ORB49424.1 hypothetical protein BST40_12475 [Mycobacterium persicum]ORB92352.1 hypothetical protein B1T49_27340 [Mycobacterium persicum]ORB97738.1 hypothetical protein B1T44_28085 [Mycobacterium persicum]ORC09804.1 hypothetical protein B4U45_27595 [Mycobacterium persicum]